MEPFPLERLALPEAKRREIAAWLADPPLGEGGRGRAEDRAALLELVRRAGEADAAALAELEDAFAGPLPIGTGGRRGACGPGPNRMNVAVLRETAQGLATVIAAQPSVVAGERARPAQPARVAVVFDTRAHSQRFAHVVAHQLAANGLEVLLVDAPRPTPQLSFLVRRHGCAAGVVISASHNPPQDNGIKIYDEEGAQVIGARDRALMAAIGRAANDPLPTATAAEVAARVRPMTGSVLDALDAEYHAWVLAQGVAPRALSLSLVYTPLHGVGHTAVVPVLRARGVEPAIVEAQLPDDGRFATVESANPELPAALELACALADRVGASFVLASDPDADRLGVCARGRDGRLAFVDGNRLAALLLDHVLRLGERPAEGWVLATMVTTPLVGKIARAHGVTCVDDLLVGFKHHAGMMAEQPERPLLFACEEAHGYLRGNDVHDKDGAVGALLFAEVAALAHARGRTIDDELERIWTEHGYHREHTANLYAYGVAGREAITALVERWRVDPPRELGGLRVASVTDRKLARTTGSATRDLPGNVIAMELEAQGGSGCRLVVRPSGTEPKAKVYALAWAAGGRELAGARAEVDRLLDTVLEDAQARARAVMDPLLR